LNANLIYLVQTDTTVGFLSNNNVKLAQIKQRPVAQKMLCVVDSFKTLKQYTRVPSKFKKMIRQAKKTSFIYPNKKSFRVINKNSRHYNFVKKFKIIYSTSANKTGEDFDLNYAIKKCDVEVLNGFNYCQNKPSNIILLGKNKFKKVR